MKNLTKKQILIIIIVIIIVLWIIYWFSSTRNTIVHNLIQPMTQLSNNDNIIYYFYHPGCPYCKMFEPVWNQLVDNLKNDSSLIVQSINATDTNQNELIKKFNIRGYPTIILKTPKGEFQYSGPRTFDNILQFVNQNI